MKQKTILLLILTVLLSTKALPQQYVDVVNFNFQTLTATYKDNSNWKSTTENYSLGIFFPKEFKNGNALLFRLNAEKINIGIDQEHDYSSSLASVSLAMGYQSVSKNKKWTAVLLGISKWASDNTINFSSNDWQYGGYFLETYKPNEKLKVKLGFYYNREAYGNFITPLVGVDWNATKKLKLYGTLPSYYRIEYNAVKNKVYTGLHFKVNSNSYNLSEEKGQFCARYDEIQLKLFADYFAYKRLLFFGELGYLLSKNPLHYKTDDITIVKPVYASLKSAPVFTLGVAYRVRFDLGK